MFKTTCIVCESFKERVAVFNKLEELGYLPGKFRLNSNNVVTMSDGWYNLCDAVEASEYKYKFNAIDFLSE